MKRKCIFLIVILLILLFYVLLSNHSEKTPILNRIKTNGIINCQRLYPVPHNPEGTYANQGFAIYNNVIFQLYNDNRVILLDYDTGELISQLDIISLHGDTIDFSNEFLKPDDEFPLAYITADSNPAKVYVVHLTKTSAELVRTYYFDDIEKTGYYAGHCFDAINNIIYLVGYSNESYYQENSNHMIVSLWDIGECVDNIDGTITPQLIDSFTIPFIITIQGQRFFKGNIYLLSSHNGVGGIDTETKIYIVNPARESIVGVFYNFPEYIKRTECEGIEIIENNTNSLLVLSTYNNTGGEYYGIY